jgi:formaldehyde-activating enzyme involved in methanogenesis
VRALGKIGIRFGEALVGEGAEVAHIDLIIEDKDKVFKYNHEATKLAIKRAMSGEPKVDEILEKRGSAIHPFYKP